MDTDEIIKKVRTLFNQYYGPRSYKLRLLEQVLSIEGINQYLREISNYEKDRMDDAIPEMIFASLFLICGFNVTFIQKSEKERRPDLKITKNLIEGFVEVKHIKSTDFDKKLKTITVATLSDITDDELLEEYGDFKKAEKILREKVFNALDQLRNYSQKHSSCNLIVAAIWNSVNEIEEIEANSSFPSLLSELKELNCDTADVLFIYGSEVLSKTYFHAYPLYLKSKIIDHDLIREIEGESIDEVHGIHKISLHEWLKSKNIE